MHALGHPSKERLGCNVGALAKHLAPKALRHCRHRAGAAGAVVAREGAVCARRLRSGEGAIEINQAVRPVGGIAVHVSLPQVKVDHAFGVRGGERAQQAAREASPLAQAVVPQPGLQQRKDERVNVTALAARQRRSLFRLLDGLKAALRRGGQRRRRCDNNNNNSVESSGGS